MSSPATNARLVLMSLLEEEFASDNFAIRPDRLDGSLGHDGAVIGVYPVREQPNPSDRMELMTTLQVQLFGAWTPQSDPNEVVDPTTAEQWAARFRQKIADYQGVGDATVWWFQLDGIEYVTDPTGNITRFTATVTARGANPAY